MTDFFESESFCLPSQVHDDVSQRLKERRGIKSLEFKFNGDTLEGASEFGRTLVALKKRGVAVRHDVSIRLDFPRTIAKDKMLELVGVMPRSRNGSLKVRAEFAEPPTPLPVSSHHPAGPIAKQSKETGSGATTPIQA